MLSCLAGICGGQGASSAATASSSPPPDLAELTKPALRVDEAYAPTSGPEAKSALEELSSRLGFSGAPPGADSPIALVSSDFTKNSSRLLIVLPSAGAPPEAWDAGLTVHGHGTMVPLLRWAQANRFAVALFDSQVLSQAPTDAWDRVLKGSPARCASILVAGGMLPELEVAMSGLHPILLARFRNVCLAPLLNGAAVMPSQPRAKTNISEELEVHLSVVKLQLPAEWVEQDAFSAHQQLFEALLRREDFWSRNEIKKYAGFRNLKENDVPGLRRMPVDKRIERISRDRGNDELARLLNKHERAAAGDEDDEPGVD